jgi:hypothetical protein
MRFEPLPVSHGLAFSATGRVGGPQEVRAPSRDTNCLKWRPIFLAFVIQLAHSLHFQMQ